jgi:hypothetical protein
MSSASTAAAPVVTVRRDADDTNLALGLKGTWGYLAQLGAVGILCWFLWFTLTHTVPDLQTSFHQELREERAALRTEMQTQRQHDTEQNRQLVERITATQIQISDTQKVVAELAAEVRAIKVIAIQKGQP